LANARDEEQRETRNSQLLEDVGHLAIIGLSVCFELDAESTSRTTQPSPDWLASPLPQFHFGQQEHQL
jgi:hypothetical protein